MLAWLLMASAVLCALAFPWLGIAACAVLLAAQVVIILSRVAVGRGSPLRPAPNMRSREPVFSVHVAIHNEPPAMVIRTLMAMAVQTWPQGRFEVIVVDNNTSDPTLWLPVQRYCATRGAPFRFCHEMGVQGAKAGALNIALVHTRGGMLTASAMTGCARSPSSASSDRSSRPGIAGQGVATRPIIAVSMSSPMARAVGLP